LSRYFQSEPLGTRERLTGPEARTIAWPVNVPRSGLVSSSGVVKVKSRFTVRMPLATESVPARLSTMFSPSVARSMLLLHGKVTKPHAVGLMT
jgi:hypothetical protein